MGSPESAQAGPSRLRRLLDRNRRLAAARMAKGTVPGTKLWKDDEPN